MRRSGAVKGVGILRLRMRIHKANPHGFALDDRAVENAAAVEATVDINWVLRRY